MIAPEGADDLEMAMDSRIGEGEGMVETLVVAFVLLGITALVLGYVLQPLWEARADDGAGGREALQAQLERIVSLLQDLETDRRTGKILEEDARELRRRYLEEGAALLRALQEGKEDPDGETQVEAAARARRARTRRAPG